MYVVYCQGRPGLRAHGSLDRCLPPCPLLRCQPLLERQTWYLMQHSTWGCSMRSKTIAGASHHGKVLCSADLMPRCWSAQLSGSMPLQCAVLPPYHTALSRRVCKQFYYGMLVFVAADMIATITLATQPYLLPSTPVVCLPSLGLVAGTTNRSAPAGCEEQQGVKSSRMQQGVTGGRGWVPLGRVGQFQAAGQD